MSNLQSLKKKALADPKVKAEYDALEPEFNVISTLLSMRETAGLTQSQVAERMGTKESNVSRLEKGTGNPTIKTLMKYAKACGCQLDFGFRHA
ncbi:helix-turn-helix transcriptional regulator [Vibrio parahaemolyticus]|uniref:helix-turn-helix domain-containing protein n=1 Tax=Vibrio parahaemolyticus TaxID=670 RepID=UPI000530D1AD|nr:helix-turn-helix transcriptional regulator [Vibrio parahaemolyticus]KGT35431.1 XRE family transcriptional regulator [Vibrio parahaemolyticus]MCC3796922.1 helix-turn-helix transcriptional regulator [Vibrio parahaemolyticus]MCC3811601.1 helix-turn-helix transcriptional regulator [Vibrio parahaemolyticus]MCR9727869.1 helix-turn-helix domain-containing protein [Vibrio parahaemolyticus]MCR9750288.1 helix-turn-helix domain-containing protein [Vibrio parahaemolyticus]